MLNLDFCLCNRQAQPRFGLARITINHACEKKSKQEWKTQPNPEAIEDLTGNAECVLTRENFVLLWNAEKTIWIGDKNIKCCTEKTKCFVKLKTTSIAV